MISGTRTMRQSVRAMGRFTATVPGGFAPLPNLAPGRTASRRTSRGWGPPSGEPSRGASRRTSRGWAPPSERAFRGASRRTSRGWGPAVRGELSGGCAGGAGARSAPITSQRSSAAAPRSQAGRWRRGRGRWRRLDDRHHVRDVAPHSTRRHPPSVPCRRAGGPSRTRAGGRRSWWHSTGEPDGGHRRIGQLRIAGRCDLGDKQPRAHRVSSENEPSSPEQSTAKVPPLGEGPAGDGAHVGERGDGAAPADPRQHGRRAVGRGEEDGPASDPLRSEFERGIAEMEARDRLPPRSPAISTSPAVNRAARSRAAPESLTG